MPDFFEGKPADISWYPPQTEEHQQKLGRFFQTQAVPQKSTEKIPRIVAAANATATTGKFESWAILGHCWGGKIATLAVSGNDQPFKALSNAIRACWTPVMRATWQYPWHF